MAEPLDELTRQRVAVPRGFYFKKQQSDQGLFIVCSERHLFPLLDRRSHHNAEPAPIAVTGFLHTGVAVCDAKIGCCKSD